jgi:hypothetical protein
MHARTPQIQINKHAVPATGALASMVPEEVAHRADHSVMSLIIDGPRMTELDSCPRFRKRLLN